NHLHALGLEVNIPAPPHNVFTVSRHMAKEKNTFREDVISTQEAGPSGSEPHPVHGARRATERVKISKCDISADKHYQQRSHLPISSQSAAMNVAVKLSTGQQSVSPLGKTQVNSSH
ncbi:uncharacterized protein LOC121879867, partial [Homarus americanus]|uniref:uncharacterized protein LOC121870482 n=1 Tax=Homarus americanus TaxID=6706 RepID=UPI001C47AA98